MKKIIITLASVLLAAGLAFGQDLAQANQIAQDAQAAFGNKNYDEALAGFQKALTMAEACGEQGAELVGTCKTAIPNIIKSIATAKVNAQDFEGGLAEFVKMAAAAKEYGQEDLLAEANENIATVKEAIEKEAANQKLADAEALYQNGDLAGALSAFQAILDETGNAQAKARIQSILLKQASANLQGGKLAQAFDGAKALFEDEAATESVKKNAAAIIAGVTQKAAASNKLSDAGKYFEQLSAMDPQNAKLGTLAYTIGAMYLKAQNKSAAKTWLQKALSDPKIAAKAQQLLPLCK